VRKQAATEARRGNEKGACRHIMNSVCIGKHNVWQYIITDSCWQGEEMRAKFTATMETVMFTD